MDSKKVHDYLVSLNEREKMRNDIALLDGMDGTVGLLGRRFEELCKLDDNLKDFIKLEEDIEKMRQENEKLEQELSQLKQQISSRKNDIKKLNRDKEDEVHSLDQGIKNISNEITKEINLTLNEQAEIGYLNAQKDRILPDLRAKNAEQQEKLAELQKNLEELQGTQKDKLKMGETLKVLIPKLEELEASMQKMLDNMWWESDAAVSGVNKQEETNRSKVCYYDSFDKMMNGQHRVACNQTNVG